MPNTINAYANIYGNIGYAVHARNFFTALNRHIAICLAPKYGALPQNLDNDLATMLGRLETIDLNATAINLDYPEEMFRFGGQTRIGYTVFESTQINPAGLHQLKQLDQVWVPSKWGKQVLIENGLDESKTHVVPEGINPTIYKSGLEPFEQITQFGDFRFLAVGKWEARKGVVELLKAFDQAFEPQDPVYLIAHFTSEVAALKNINVNQEIDKLGLKNRKKIILIDSALGSEMEMARLYNSCQAFVSASKAEGWGLPISEALACGRIVIAPGYSAPTEYLNNDIATVYEVTKLEDVYCPLFFPNKGSHGQWAQIDVDQLSHHLRHVWQNQDQAKLKAQKAETEMKQNWTWESAAQKALTLLS